MNTTAEWHGHRVLICDAEGPLFRGDRDTSDLVAAGFEARAEWIALPVSRLGEEFFRLRTRIAGEMIQKFVNYRFRVAIVGDISEYLKEGVALRDFVAESNRGSQVWFVATLDELRARLA
jgi:hypothetical protein